MNPARHFINDRLAIVKKDIQSELGVWYKDQKKSGLEFSGSAVMVFWDTNLKKLVARLIDEAFAAGKQIAEENRFDPVDTMRDAGDAANDAIHLLVHTMVGLDRSLRGKGFPGDIEPRNADFERDECLKRLQKRTDAEVEAARSRGRTTVTIPLSSDHGMLWFFVHSGYVVRFSVLGAIATIWLSGLGIGWLAFKNDLVRRSVELLDEHAPKKDSTAAPIAPPITQPNAALPAATNTDTTAAPTTTNTNKSN